MLVWQAAQNATRTKTRGGWLDMCGKIRAILSGRVRPLRKREIRVIRLSKKAIQELLWEHFMEVGDALMELPEESDDVIFHMHVAGELEELTLYVVNLNEVLHAKEVPDRVFEKIREYCDRNIGFTTDSLVKKPEKSPCYVSVTF